MTKFNPEGKELLTLGESLGPAMKITNKVDAAQYLNDYIAYTEKFSKEFLEGKTAKEVCLSNLGYYAGYYGTETQKRVQDLFMAAHPIFNKI